VLLLLIFVGAVAGLLQGWHVEKLRPAQLETLLEASLVVYRPSSAPGAARDSGHPTILLFHGCGGARVSQREWAQRFADIGWLAVVVDSNRPRGLAEDEVCSGRALHGGERAGDVLVALDRVRRLEGVDPEQIVLAGWSHGAWSIMDLLAMNPPAELPHNLSRTTESGLAGIAGLVFVYPYCGFGAKAQAWPLRAPSLHLHVDGDSVAAPEACAPIVEGLRAAGQRVEVERIMGVDHAFDEPDLPADVPLAYHEDATQSAVQRIGRFLQSIEKGSGLQRDQ